MLAGKVVNHGENTSVLYLLHVPYLNTALGEAKPLLDHSGQLSDPAALLTKNILGP